jgi:hypothetical protein
VPILFKNDMVVVASVEDADRDVVFVCAMEGSRGLDWRSEG